uniref:hypothetical protein n=1 Tax=Salmonella sp. s51228 TaxID=3159652 RepID=UPI00397EADD9
MTSTGNIYSPQALNNEQVKSTNPFQPSRKKLTGIEGHRILAVYDEFILSIELMSILPLAIRYIDRLSVDYGSHLIEHLYAFIEISNSFTNNDKPFPN